MTDSKTEEWQSRECSMGTRAEDNSPEAESRFDKTKMTDGIILDIEANRELQRFQEEDDFELILTRMEVESGISSSNTSPRLIIDEPISEKLTDVPILQYNEYESDSLENTRPNTPELKSDREFQEELQNQFESMKNAPKHSESSTKFLELDFAHVKERLAAKEREVEGLYSQILNQDKAFAEAYREQEASFREREEKLIVKLFDEVKSQTDLRIEQQRKIGEQEERIRNLQNQLDAFRRNDAQFNSENEIISNDSSYESEDLRGSCYWSPKLDLSSSVSMHNLSLNSPTAAKYPNRPLGTKKKQTHQDVPNYLPRYGSRMSLSSLAESRRSVKTTTTQRTNLSKTKSISNLSQISRISSKSQQRHSTGLTKSHSNWDLATKSPKRSPRENSVSTQAWPENQVNKSANRFASRLKEYDSMENDLKSMKQKRSELSRSLRMLDSGRDGSSRHNARQRKDQLEIELDAVDREIHSLKRGLTQ
ncbi:unnamed protein product [Oikopleura dioica]|uniref:Uncharacterized protein n=1 Tax=Oikopleura dioica TaxID=34765 RepID=E4Y8R5_OIKDI|nr:unnamed protein product [Oikopleura dioica]